MLKVYACLVLAFVLAQENFAIDEDLTQNLLINNRNREEILKYLNYVERRDVLLDEKLALILRELSLVPEKIDIMKSCLTIINMTKKGVTVEEHYEVAPKEKYFRTAWKAAEN
ncbi:hypothetical protein HELRODRAFT_165513 [Helobdella robusta]|uniref:Uncharacterized protein n=1 Tax=Helobdella robusta TaxID=6412 RepID=T1EWY3_HELRO|nr:hypothetical protein HELRODRAFT_165513 [Helobdella robusta]ESN91474.1 hypothetical protein HELRODRAFT_165513 [Helobdella robusta]